MTVMMDTPVVTRRVVTYERVSSEDQRERATIAMQVSALDARLAAEPGASLVERYVDDGVSTRIPLARRPAGARLLQDAEARRFDEIWVYRLDRLGRKVADVATIADRLGELDIAIVTVTQGRLEPFILHIYAALAEEEMLTLRQRTSGGITEAAEQGRYMGGIVPYGYRPEGEKGHARLVPDEDEVCPGWSAVDVVRFMFTKIAVDDWSAKQAADHLNALGVPTSYARDGRGIRGKRTRGLWTRGRIGNLVKEPIYRGEQVFGRRSKKARVTISAPVPALVSAELWRATQEALARHRICARNTRRVYLLRSVMRCSLCGLTYVGSQSDGKTWYRCNGYLTDRGPLEGRCPSLGVKGERLEPVVWQDIERWLRDPGDLLEELDPQREQDEEAAKRARELEAIEQGLGELDAQQRQAQRLAVRGSLTDADLDAELDRIAAERAILEQHGASIAPSSTPPEPVDGDLLDELRSCLDAGLSDAQRQEIVRLLVARITITTIINDDGTKDAKATVKYNFPRVVQTRTGHGFIAATSWRRAG